MDNLISKAVGNDGFIFLTMVFLHIIDDFVLQSKSFLVDGKQKEWWEKTAPDRFYRYDYIWVLLMHSFSWTFSIMLPTAVACEFELDGMWFVFFFVNVALHALTDDLKANRKLLNLWEDQVIHLMQIMATALLVQ